MEGYPHTQRKVLTGREMDMREYRAHRLKWVVIYNVAVLAAIAVCTASIAYFTGSIHALWAMLLALLIASDRIDDDD